MEHTPATSLDKTWEPRAPMATARSHVAAAVWENRIYVVGGGGPNFQSLNAVEVYDPQADEWSAARAAPTTRSGAIAVTLGWEVYVMGGGFRKPDGRFTFLKTVDVYTPVKDLWQEGPELLMPHDYPGATVFNGRIVVLGGHHPDIEGGPKTDPGFAFCEQLDPTAARWTEMPPLPTPRFALAAVVYGGRLLAMGGCGYRPAGFKNFHVVESYDPRQGRWVEEPAYALPWPAAGLAACVLNGRLYIFGGYGGETITDRAAVYDPARRAWRDLPPMPAPRAAMAAVPVGDTIYLIGGWAADGKTPLSEVIAYGPAGT